MRGALEFGEPGLFVSFEESPRSLAENFQSLGFDIAGLIKSKKLKLLHVDFTAGEVVKAGDFTLDALNLKRAVKDQKI